MSSISWKSLTSTGLAKLVVTAGVLQQGTPPLTMAVRKSAGKFKGTWEFPGGKQEDSESLSECLHRELREELCIDADIGVYIGCSEFQTASNIIELHAFLVPHWRGELQLTEHDAVRWLVQDQLHSLNWSPADVPLLEKISRLPTAVESR